MSIKVKKVAKYSKYFLLLVVASLISVVVTRSKGHLSNTTLEGVIPSVHADVGGTDSGDSGGTDSGDSGGSDCDDASGGSDCDGGDSS